MFKVIASLGLIWAFSACSTTPSARSLRFDVDWIRSTVKQEQFGYLHPERTAPLIDGSMLYVGNAVDGLVAFDRRSGREVWRRDVLNGLESGIALDGDSLYFGASDGQFYSINKFSGKIQWAFPTRAENLAPPLITNGIVYFLAGNNILYSLDAKTGKQLWVYNRGETSSLSVRGGARPALYKDVIYEGFSDGYLVALNSRDGSLMWERKLSNKLKFIDVDASPVVDENSIWVSSYDGSLFCLSRPDGQVQWRLDDGGSTAVTITGDTLYYASLSQNVYALNKTTGKVKWKYNFAEKYGVPTRPKIYKGLILFGASDGLLTALSETTGKPLATYDPGSGVFATPALDGEGDVYILSNQANLHALKIAWRRTQDKLEYAGTAP